MQEEILKLLQKKGRPLGRTEIAEILQERPQKVSNRIKQMLKSKQIKCLEIDRFEARRRFNSRRRMRLYYL